MPAPWLRGVALIAALSAPAFAQISQEEAPVTEGRPKFTPPQLVKRVSAPYPKEALEKGLSGTVVLEFDVDEKGVVSNVQVKQGAGHGFDEAAAEAVKQFQFTPAMNDRTPVPSRVTYAYKFVLKTAPPPPAVVKKKLDDAVRIQGRVLLRGTRTSVAGGKVIAVPKDKLPPEYPERFESELDDDGRFALRGLPAGRYKVVATGPQANRHEVEETLGERDVITVNYYVEPLKYSRYEATVRADPNREEIARQTLTTEELVKMPGSMGDALKAVENLPGVARAPFNTGLIIVRGGKPTDSRVFLGASEVPQLYHFGALRSVMPTQIVDKVDYFAGNFGVRYGRATAGVIDVELREGQRDRWHGAAEVNVFDVGAMAEGPVKKGSLILSARRSYIDAVIGAALPADAGLKFTSAPVYWDYQGILDYPVSGGKLRAMVIGSDDTLKLVFDDPAGDPALTAFGTHIFFHKALFRYTRAFGRWSLFSQLAGGYQGQSGAVGRDVRFDIGVGQIDTRLEARYRHSSQLQLLLGTDALYANVSLATNVPPPIREGQIPSPISAGERSTVNEVSNMFQIGLYTQAIWKPTKWLTITPGLRFDYYSPLRRPSFDPRGSVRAQVAKYTWLKAGVGLYSQHPQPTDYSPSFGNAAVRPEKALHTALTLEQGLLPGLMGELTGFYKHLWDLSAPTPFYLWRDGAVAAERVASVGMGRIYGMELLLRQSVSKWFFGWVSYTLMRSERRDCETCAWRLFDFDQTHIFIVALHAYLPKGWELGARFRYISGMPYTPTFGGYYDADSDVYSPARLPVNTARLADFHSLDFRIDKTFLFKKWVLKAYLDIINIYNRRNQEVAQPSYDFTRNTPIVGLPIIPSLGVRGEF